MTGIKVNETVPLTSRSRVGDKWRHMFHAHDPLN